MPLDDHYLSLEFNPTLSFNMSCDECIGIFNKLMNASEPDEKIIGQINASIIREKHQEKEFKENFNGEIPKIKRWTFNIVK